MYITKTKSDTSKAVSTGNDVLYSCIMLDDDAVDAAIGYVNSVLKNAGHEQMNSYAQMHSTLAFYGGKDPFTDEFPHLHKEDLHKRVMMICTALGVYYAPNEAGEVVAKNVGLLVDPKSLVTLNDYNDTMSDLSCMYTKHSHITVAIDKSSAAKYTDKCFHRWFPPKGKEYCVMTTIIGELVLTGTFEYVNTKHQIIDRFVSEPSAPIDPHRLISTLLQYGLDNTTLLYLYKIRDSLGCNAILTIEELGDAIKNHPETIMLRDGIGKKRYAKIVSAYNACMGTDYSTEYKEVLTC